VAVVTLTDSEVGEAAARGALDAEGLLGAQPGQLPPHRLLCCSTAVGKLSIIRQLEADIHIEADLQTATELHRLKAKIVYVPTKTGAEAPSQLNVIGGLDAIV